jgi:ribonuclease T1
MSQEPPSRPHLIRSGLFLTLILLLLLPLIAACGSGPALPEAAGQVNAVIETAVTVEGQANGTSRATATPAATVRATATPRVQSASGLPTIGYQSLPREAKETIGLIEQDGPFPFERDGITFQNRERLLPNKPNGYYREYTVITPGSRDRGARRIVAGAEGELYYTDDHYESFKEVIR